MLEPWTELRCALGLDERALRRAKVVFDNDWQFQEFHGIAREDLVINGGGGHDNLANLRIHADGEIAHAELRSAENRVLTSMVSGVGGKANFPPRDDRRAARLLVRPNHGDLAINVEFQ